MVAIEGMERKQDVSESIIQESLQGMIESRRLAEKQVNTAVIIVKVMLLIGRKFMKLLD